MRERANTTGLLADVAHDIVPFRARQSLLAASPRLTQGLDFIKAAPPVVHAAAHQQRAPVSTAAAAAAAAAAVTFARTAASFATSTGHCAPGLGRGRLHGGGDNGAEAGAEAGQTALELGQPCAERDRAQDLRPGVAGGIHKAMS